MASHNEIVAFLDDFLEIGSFSDYGPNGLLVPGAEEVTKVPTCPSTPTPRWAITR
jgi:putative NIF3 family GTP cyclohydrolase 1 type 2